MGKDYYYQELCLFILYDKIAYLGITTGMIVN